MTDAQKHHRRVSTHGGGPKHPPCRSFERLPHNGYQASGTATVSAIVPKTSAGDFRDRVAEEITGMRQRLGQRSDMRSDQVGSSPQTAVKTEHIEFEETKNGDLLRSLALA